MSIRDLGQDEQEPLKLMTIEDTVESTGHVRAEPIIHLMARTAEGKDRRIEVEGFYPYFWIRVHEFIENKEDLLNEGQIRYFEMHTDTLAEIGDPDLQYNSAIHEVSEHTRALHDDPLIKVVVGDPDDIQGGRHKTGLAEFFDDPLEADVFYRNQFLVHEDIKTGFKAPRDKDRIHVSELEPLDPDDVPAVTPRMITLDIEVYTDGPFPEPTEAEYPVISIVAHDNYADDYQSWILLDDEWNLDGYLQNHIEEIWDMSENELLSWLGDYFEDEYEDTWGSDVQVFENEAYLLDDFHSYVAERGPDMMTGWNAGKNEKSSGFDFPYLINRSFKVNAWNIKEWSPLDDGDVFVTRGGTAVCQGIELMDMMAGYMKTQYHELRSYSLNFVADHELGYGKEDIQDISDAWQHDTEQFLNYNFRDVEAVVEIEEKKDILELFDHLRRVTGASYTECASGNIGMIDMLFLRDAFKKNLALPTSRKPDEGYYHGARVFNPTPGRHENVFYPDLASLYPYLFFATNMSPETVVGTQEELEASEYTEDDCFIVYCDPRGEDVKRAAGHTDVVEEIIYVLKPDIREGFVRDSIGDLIDMKYEYSGTDVYQAVKMVTNSVYGVMGDSETFGKGFRLFDVQIAEAITLAGRKVLEFTADTMETWLHDNGYPDSGVVGGDTDSAMLAGKDLPCDPEHIQRAFEGETEHPVFEAAKYVNMAYDEFMSETFHIRKEEGYDHMMEVEVESAADAIFFLQDYKPKAKEGDGIKKKYSQTMVWKDSNGGTIIEDPSPETKGFQLVRSDTATITAWAQERVLDLILRSDDAKDDVYDFLEDVLEHLEAGDLDGLSEMYGAQLTLEDVGIPKGISSELDQYGREKLDDDGNYGEHVRTPSPVIRGAKWANQNLGEDIGPGKKPLLFYVTPGRIGGDYSNTYTTEESLENGTLVDAISVIDHRTFPTAEASVDWSVMAEKLVKNPIEDIARTMGWEWDDITNQGRQAGLGAWA